MKDLDYGLIYGLADKISHAVSIILGFVAVILVIWLTVVTAVDVMYISWPVMQSVMERKFDGKKFGGLRLLSEDARNAVDEAAANGTSATVLYLKKRMITYLFAAFLLYLVITGGSNIREIVEKGVVGILRAMGLLA